MIDTTSVDCDHGRQAFVYSVDVDGMRDEYGTNVNPKQAAGEDMSIGGCV